MRSKDYFYDAYFNSLDLDIDGNSSDKKLVSDAINVIGEQLSNESLSVQEIATHLNLSRSKLYRKIKSLTNMSANELIRKIRLEKSKELLEQTDLSVGEICFRVGFSSPSYFTKRFKSHTGLVPKEYRLQNKKMEDTIEEPILDLTDK
jgi:AraC-like DNA-binding protein